MALKLQNIIGYMENSDKPFCLSEKIIPKQTSRAKSEISAK